MSFANLKKNRKSQFDKLAKAAEQLNTSKGGGGKDDRFWKPTVDAAGNGSAIIRFLPPVEGEDVPFVRYWDHGFQGPGGWYIEKSLTSIGQDDPVSEYNSKLWNSGVDSDKEVARKQKRRLHYISNIYVIKDPGNPSNEGKVFLYEYGKKIFDKINDLMHPSFEDEDPVNPFDFWEGSNFRMRIRQVEGYRNYDKSDFDTPSALFDDDEKLEAIYNAQHELQPLVDPKAFKSYEELLTRMTRVLGFNPTANVSAANAPEEDAPWTPPVKEEKEEKQTMSTPSFDSEDDDESLAFFQKLANE